MEGLRDDESVSDDIRRERRRGSSHKILKFAGSAAASWQDGHKAVVASRRTKATDRISVKKHVQIAAASLASSTDQPLHLHPLRQAVSQSRKCMMLSASMMIADLLNHFLSLTT
ncbi:hypothetical protein CFC21_108902 [Triticum aestivum]|uniref:Uncharacterized protein n=2 Tax=Triticum aestivum TaxID=4565 RepID=A0A3B6TQD7_WHEAT|nr:hypothetical protein CFC21_108902 [Triticum aestivum]